MPFLGEKKKFCSRQKRYDVCPALWCSWLVWSVMLGRWPEHHIFWTTLRSCVHGWLVFLRYCAGDHKMALWMDKRTSRWLSPAWNSDGAATNAKWKQQPWDWEFFYPVSARLSWSWWQLLNVISTVLSPATFRQCCHCISLPCCYETRILFCMLI